MSENEKKKLLEIKDLKIYYPIKGKRDAEGKPAYVKAVDGVTFDVYENETFGLVGESGCGKSTTGRTVVRLNKPTAGSVTFEGHDLFAKMNRQQNMDLTQKIQIIYQDPYSSLDPRFTVGRCIEEPLILDPKIVVCDEPVSALDVSIQSQIINLLKELQRKRGLTYLFVAHDMSVIRYISDRVGVMYLGHLVEEGDTDEVFDHPQHPYTRTLMSAVPSIDPRDNRQRILLEGDLPSPIDPPSGCVFHTRCPWATEACKTASCELREVRAGHYAACSRGKQE